MFLLGLVYKLQNIMNQSYEESEVSVILSKYILENLSKSGSFTLKKICDDCGVSGASITRFSKDLGYNGFLELKNEIVNIELEVEEMRIDLEVPRRYFNENNHSEHFGKFINRLSRSIGSLESCETFSYNYLAKLSKMMFESERIIIFATQIPATIMLNFQHALLTFGKTCRYYPMHKDQLLQSADLNKNDLAIFVSLSGSYVSQKDITINVMNSDAKTFIITQNDHIKMSQGFDSIIQLGLSEDEIIGKYKLMIFIESLMQVYANKYVE